MRNHNTTHKIKSHHHSLASAVAESKMDLSYNPEEARKTIRDIDLNCKHALVMENGDVYFVFSCDIEILHKFEPFVSCLSDAPFHGALIAGDTLTILSNLHVPKDKAGRAWLREANKQVGLLAA